MMVLAFEVRQRRFGQVKEGEDIGAKGPFELLGADLLNALLRVLLSRIIDQDIKTTECGKRLFYGVTAPLLISNVTHDRQTTAAFSLNLAFRLFGIAVLIKVHDRDIGSLGCEREGYRSPNAAVAAGDQGRFPREFAAAAVARVLCARARRHLRLHTRLMILMLRRVLLRIMLHCVLRSLSN